MKRSTQIWLGIIGILIFFLCIVWIAIIATGFMVGGVTPLLALVATETSTPTITPEPTATPTLETTPTPTSKPSNTPTSTSSPLPTPTLVPPFPTPEARKALPERPLRIGYMADEGDDNWEIFVADADGGNAQNISSNPGIDVLAVWSPYAERLAWVTSRFGPGAEVIIADAEGNKMSNVSNQVETNDLLPVWSPNGQFIAYASNRFRDREIFISLPDGTSYNLSNNEADDVFFDWSPACADIQAGDDWSACQAIIGSNRNRGLSDFAGQYTLYFINADGSNLDLALDVDLKASEAVFSPDGTQIAYLKLDPKTRLADIYKLDLATQEETRLTEDEVIKSDIAWSPLGDLIAYVASIEDDTRNSPFPNDIYTVSVDKGETKRLTDPRERDALFGDFAWSPDGKKILFSTLRDGNPEIYVMDVDGNNPTNLTNTPTVVEVEPFWME